MKNKAAHIWTDADMVYIGADKPSADGYNDWIGIKHGLIKDALGEKLLKRLLQILDGTKCPGYRL